MIFVTWEKLEEAKFKQDISELIKIKYLRTINNFLFIKFSYDAITSSQCDSTNYFLSDFLMFNSKDTSCSLKIGSNYELLSSTLNF